MQQTHGTSDQLRQPARVGWREWAVDASCASFAALPLVLTAHIPLYDVPNHVAMLHVLLERAHSPVLQKIYGVHWTFMPNMGLQVVTWLLAPLFGVEGAVRVFCIAVVLLLCAGTRALSLALADGVSALRVYRAAPLLCWGAPLQFGFLSYCLGIGLMLIGLAAYVRLAGRGWPRGAAVLLPFGIALLAVHLIAFGIFVTAISGYEVTQAIGQSGGLRQRVAYLARRSVIIASLTIPALIVLALTSSLGQTAAPAFTEHNHLVWGSVSKKLQGLAAITWFAMPRVEIPLLAAALACLAAGLRWRLVRLSGPALGVVALLGGLWLVLPIGVPTGYYVDYRLPWAISFVGLAGISAGASTARHGALWHGLTYAMAFLVIVRIGSMCWRTLRWEPEIAAIDQALGSLPPGVSVFVVRGLAPGQLMKTPPLEHAAAYAVARRQGFEPQIFAGTAGSMVSLNWPYRGMYAEEAPSVLWVMPQGYDALLVLNPSLAMVAVRPPLSCVARGPDFMLLIKAAAGIDCS